MTISLSVVLYLALELAAVYCAWRAVQGARTPQGSVGWVVFLLAVPFIALPAYLLLGHHRLRGVRLARLDSERAVARLQEFARSYPPAQPPPAGLAPFEAVSNLTVTGGNSMALLVDGAATFDAICAAIDGAGRYVLVQFYILRADGLGRRLQRHLLEARRRGVEVYLVYDAVGSSGLPASYRDALVAAGAHVVDPRRERGLSSRLRINYRNHRKCVIVDGERGFTGGLNVGDEYLGLDPRMGPWRDTFAALAGPIVAQLQLVFMEDWHYATGELIAERLSWRPERHRDEMTALLVPTGPADPFDTGSMFFFSAIARAERRLWIASPYFVPDIDTLSALKHAALRGVDVRILVPDVIDHRMPWLAAFAYFDEVMQAGVQIWRYTEGFMHQKIVLADDDFAAVGTANLDNRSFRLNFEAMAVFFDPRAAQDLEEMLVADFARAFRLQRRLAEQPLRVRVGAPVSRLFAPIL